MEPDVGFRRIDSRFVVSQAGEFVSVTAYGSPIASFHESDTAARDLTIAQLCKHSGVKEEKAAKAFGVSRATVARAKREYSEGGVAALVPKRRGPVGPTKLKGAKRKSMLIMTRAGRSNSEIGRRLGVSENAVRAALLQFGFGRAAPVQASLPLDVESTTEPEEASARAEQLHDDVCESHGENCSLQHVEECPESAVPAGRRPDGDEHGQRHPEEDALCDVSSEVDLGSRDGASCTSVPVRSMAGTRAVESPTGIARGDERTADERSALVEPKQKPASNSDELAQGVDGSGLPAQATADDDPEDRALDRLLARMGILSDAAPLFGNRQNLPRAGLLLAIPILETHHVYEDATATFQPIGPAFYGLRNTALALTQLFLARIGRPECLKEHSPQDLGAIIGLDRFPEMKTLRRKIGQLSDQNASLQFMKRLTSRHLQRIKGEHVWLYLDGHVSVYSGKRKLKKHHVTRLRTSLPSVLDYWLNDDKGDPLMVVTGNSKGTMKSLPEIISDLRKQGEHRPLTIAFDREGWSPELFAELAAMPDVSFLTYRKAKPKKGLPKLPVDDFKEHTQDVDGESVSYNLADKGIYVDYGPRKARRRLHLRQVTRLNDNGHQTHIVTNDTESGVFELAHSMFSRWTQENFFKYMRAEMELDGLYTYLMEDGDGERLVPNPKRKGLDAKIAILQKKHDRLVAEYGQLALSNEEKRRKTMRGFKSANGALGKEIRESEARIDKVKQKRESLPAKVPVNETLKGDKMKKVRTETRRLLHCFRMLVYRAESALRELIRPHYKRWRQDGRTIVQSMLQSKGDIEVTDTELHVALAPQSAPHRTKALSALCEELNALDVKFPGSNLWMRFSVSDDGTSTRECRRNGG